MNTSILIANKYPRAYSHDGKYAGNRSCPKLLGGPLPLEAHFWTNALFFVDSCNFYLHAFLCHIMGKNAASSHWGGHRRILLMHLVWRVPRPWVFMFPPPPWGPSGTHFLFFLRFFQGTFSRKSIIISERRYWFQPVNFSNLIDNVC